MGEVTSEADARPIDRTSDPFGFGAHVARHDDGSCELNVVIENLHCPQCIGDIERALERVPGLLEGRVNLSTKRLRIRWWPDRATMDELVRSVTDQGYTLTAFDPEELDSIGGREESDLLRALAVAGFAAGNVMLLSVSVWAGLWTDMGDATRSLMHWVSALIALPAVAYAGRPFYRSGLAAVRNGRLNMDVPISLAVLLAAGMSLFETIAGREHVYFDAAVTLLFFLLIGRYLDAKVRGRVRSVAENLALLKGTPAVVEGADGARKTVPASRVQVGETVIVAPGERVPVDGLILSGLSEADCSLVSGESIPQRVAPGDEVHAGTLNLSGTLRLGARSVGERTLLAEIVRLTEAGEQGRARYVRIADRAARIYAPAVHLLALASFLLWTLAFGLDWQPALLIAISVLIVTCPCALGLAVPAVQVATVNRLFRRGILVKAADGIERLAEIDRVVLDKTGTLTRGRPELICRDRIDRADLRLAASLAAGSRHPLARAICRAAGPVPVFDGEIREIAGYGLTAVTPNGEVRLGNRLHCGSDGRAPGETDEMELWLRRADGRATRFAFHDELREDAAELVRKVRRQGLVVEVLSGDRPNAVGKAAAALGIAIWRGGCGPEEKIRHLEALDRDGHKVLMVGDGLNDAPSLASAFASISLSDAAGISQTAADFILQSGRISGILEALAAARAARRLVWQNFAIAFAYNAVAVPLAIAGMVTPLIAAVAMSASSIVVTLNSLRGGMTDRKGTA